MNITPTPTSISCTLYTCTNNDSGARSLSYVDCSSGNLISYPNVGPGVPGEPGIDLVAVEGEPHGVA